MSPVTRRTLIGTGAAAGAAAVVPGTATARRPKPRRADVIVVGAGLSGLQAASDVAAAGKSVLVVEARKRVGGRTLNHKLGPAYPGKVIEIGGQWIGPTQTKLAGLATELGIETFKTYNEGSYLYYRNGTKTPYEVQPPPIGAVPPDPQGVAEAFVAILRLNEMAATIDVEKPWAAANAETWDSQTFHTWIEDNARTPNGKFLLELGIEAVFAAPVSYTHLTLPTNREV